MENDAKDWALNTAGDTDAAFFTAAYATDAGVRSEAVIACRLPRRLAPSFDAELGPLRKPEVYLRPSISITALDDDRQILVVWFGIRLLTHLGEAKWIARLNPCSQADDGFPTLNALPALNSIKLHVWSNEDPLTFEIPFTMGIKTQLARVLGAATGGDRFSIGEFEAASRLQLDDPETKAALLDELFPDVYPE